VDQDLPAFETQRIATQVNLIFNAPVLVGTLNPPTKTGLTGLKGGNESDRIWLAFLSALTPNISRCDPATQCELPRPAPPPPSEPAAEDSQPKPSARFQWELISLPQAAAASLLAATPDDTELHGKLHGLISAKQAKLETVQLLNLAASKDGAVEHIHEFPFASDYDTPQVPHLVTITDPSLRKQLLRPADGTNALPPPNEGANLISRSSPTAFTVRNLGDSLTLAPHENDDGTYKVRIGFGKVRLLSMMDYEDCAQPIFGTQSVTTDVQISLNYPLLICTQNRPQSTNAPGSKTEDRVWLAFLTARDPSK
jgi:hypothetical protein